MIPFIFHKRLFILLFFSFIAFTVIGTLTHECGHYFAGVYYGWKGQKINYNSTSWGTNYMMHEFDSLREKNIVAINKKLPFPEKLIYENLEKELYRRSFIIRAWGPLETILTGTIGLLLIFLFRRKFFERAALSDWQWLLILISLFWLRQSFNLAFHTFFYIIKGRAHRCGSDEVIISKRLGFPPFALEIAGGVIASLILALLVFKFIPAQQRFTFLCAGLLGGMLGAVLWLYTLGPVIMP